MSKKEINKDIWINSYPILIWLMTEPLAGLVDSRIAGIIGIDTLSSVGIGTTIYFVFTWIFVFLAYGTTPLVAKLKTNNKLNNLKYFVSFGKKISIMLGLLVFIIIYYFNDFFISLFKPTDEINNLASIYLIVRALGIPFYLLNMHSTAVLRGLRYPNITFQSSIIVTLTNITLSYFLGIMLGLGVLGIGLASSTSFFIASIYANNIQQKKLKKFSHTSDDVDQKKLKKKFFSVGGTIVLRSAFLTGFMALLSNQASRLSMNDIALHHVLNQIWTFGYNFIDALAIASQTLVSEHISKGKKYFGSDLYRALLKITTIFSLVATLVSYLSIKFLTELISNQVFIQLENNYLLILFSLSLFFGSYAFLWDGVLLGLDKNKEFAYTTIISSILGALVLFILIANFGSINIIWLSLVISLIFRALIGGYFQRR
ncbi:MAG: MATE family efflux transporter [Candidatus Actinomarinales bacterium]|nr:MAG: MATE family efflux transporter [Candidatus Actinomarinales bacterium]